MRTTPIYVPDFYDGVTPSTFAAWADSIPWLAVTNARRECFMNDTGGVHYTYGEGRGVRTYTSIPATADVLALQEQVNDYLDTLGWGPMNGCFLNRYDGYRNALGWHADDFRNMDHSRPIVVVSLGQEREIWWRPNGQAGLVPADQRCSLAHGSLFVMPPGFQHTHEHRIPKGSSQQMTARVSLTYRAFFA